MKLFLDIETCPTQNESIMEDIRSSIKAPGNYKKPESIEQWHKDHGEAAFEEEYRKTALSGTTGEIICISWAIDDNEPKTAYRKLDEPEWKLLSTFFETLIEDLKAPHSGYFIKPVWIGHNILGFDLRYLWQRCIVNNVKPIVDIPYDAKPWDEKVFDTLYEWTGLNKAGGSLDKVSRALGFQGKGEITGANVWDYVKAGKEDEVAEYCKQDVILTRNIYKRMTWS